MESRIVAAKYQSAGQTITNSATLMQFNTKVYDTHSAVTTGASWKFTAPIAGKYQIHVGMAATSSDTTSTVEIQFRKNGAVSDHGFYETFIGQGAGNYKDFRASATIDLVAGDYVDFYSSAFSVTGFTIPAGKDCYITIDRISGPATVTANEVIVLRAQGIPTNGSASGGQTVLLPTKTIDTHNAYNSATGLFTVPVAGYYRVTGMSSIGGTESSDQYVAVAILKNGSYQSYEQWRAYGSITEVPGVVCDILSCVAGDTISLATDTTITSPAYTADANKHNLSIEKIN